MAHGVIGKARRTGQFIRIAPQVIHFIRMAQPRQPWQQEAAHIHQQREEILVQVVTVMENVVVDQPVDVIGQEARIQNRVDEMAAGVPVVDRVIFGISVAIERLCPIREATKAIALQEPS